ncbi:MAG: formylglycine-generating enzyme family protein [Desulfonatronovibrio sp.]
MPEADNPDNRSILKALQREGKLTVRALRAWDQLPERFMQLTLDLRAYDLDILRFDQTMLEELALQAREDDRLSGFAQELKALTDYMATLVPDDSDVMGDAEMIVAKSAEPAISLPPDGVPGWVLIKVDKTSGQSTDTRTNTYDFTLDKNGAVGRSSIRQSGSGYSRQVKLAFDFSWTQPPDFAFKEDTWQGQVKVSDKGNGVKYLQGTAPEIDPNSGGFRVGAGYRAGQRPIMKRGSAAIGVFSPDNPNADKAETGKAEIRWPDRGCPGDQFTVEMSVQGWAGRGTVIWTYEYHQNMLRSPLFIEQFKAMQELEKPLPATVLEVIQDCPECPKMVIVPVGTFTMGSPDSEHGRRDNEGPARTVTVEKPFALAKTPVTQGQWLAVMDSNPSHFVDCDLCPVENVSRLEANTFLQALSEKTGHEYRLPSEAEWEYACRAGQDHRYCGSNDIDEVSWYRCNSEKRTHPVATKAPNAFGLYDMSGNVDEWIRDCYNDSYDGAPDDASPWRQGDCRSAATRGGNWESPEDQVRYASRIRGGTMRFGHGGLRPVRSIIIQNTGHELPGKGHEDVQTASEETPAVPKTSSKISMESDPKTRATKEYTVLGLGFQAPETLVVIKDEEDELVLGAPDWERMLSDHRFDEPLGMMIAVRMEQRANLGFLDAGSPVERLHEKIMLGNKTFAQYTVQETKEYEQGTVHRLGHMLVARTPSKAGRYLAFMVNYVGESRDAALQSIGDVVESLKAVAPQDFTDEIPYTKGLDSMLRMRIPPGMNQNWDRSDFFRIQTDASPYTYFEVKTGERAQKDIDRVLRLDPKELAASRGEFFGHPVIIVQQEFENAFSTRKIFENCLSDNDPVILTMRVHPQWLEEHGGVNAILNTLEFELPENAGTCPAETLNPVLEHLGLK